MEGEKTRSLHVVLRMLNGCMCINEVQQTLTPCTKINSKCLKDLNIRHDTIKLLDESIDKTFSDINHTNVYLGQSPKAIEIKIKIKINK